MNNNSIYYKDDLVERELPTMDDARFEQFFSGETCYDLEVLTRLFEKHGVDNKLLMKDIWAWYLREF